MIRPLLVSLALSTATLVPAAAFACNGAACDHPKAAATATAESTGSAVIPDANRSTATLAVTGMTCGGCAGRVTAALLGVSGVGKADVDHKAGTAVVTFDKTKTSIQSLIQAVTGLGYGASDSAGGKQG